MFRNLAADEMEVIIDALIKKEFAPGVTVIKEGDPGSVAYLVGEGNLECFKIPEGQSEPQLVKTYEPGWAFGALALLYNAPRAASIVTKTECVLWELDRETFNHIVKDVIQCKREKYETFLSEVPILTTVNSYERAKLADCI